jgi:hypothetical protein
MKHKDFHVSFLISNGPGVLDAPFREGTCAPRARRTSPLSERQAGLESEKWQIVVLLFTRNGQRTGFYVQSRHRM